VLLQGMLNNGAPGEREDLVPSKAAGGFGKSLFS